MIDIQKLSEQNIWWQGKEKINEDINLLKLSSLEYIWYPKVLESFDLVSDNIYTLRGSRQIGKTTGLKLLIKKLLLEKNHPKEWVYYFTCNNIDTYKELIEILEIYLGWLEHLADEVNYSCDGNYSPRKYIFIDEITFVSEWTKALKYLADLGSLRGCTIIVTGSNAHDLKNETERMPGRRGTDKELDKFFYPLSFKEYIKLTNPVLAGKFINLKSAQKNYLFCKKELNKCLEEYMLSGGFICAVNSMAKHRKIDINVYQQYLGWVLGDLAKLGRKEMFTRQILERVIKNLTSNLGFDTIAKATSIDSHITVNDYLDVMESNFIIKVLYNIDTNSKTVNYKKNKKVYFQDLFLYWIFLGYTLGLSDYFDGSKRRLQDYELKSKLVENLVMSYLMRLENVFNWSNKVFLYRTVNKVEVDFIVKTDDMELFPIEVKYQNKVTFKDFLHLNKINKDKGIIVSKQDFIIDANKMILPVEVFLLMDFFD